MGWPGSPAPRRPIGAGGDLVPDLQRLVEGLALRTPPPSAASVQRQVAAVARRQGWPVPSYSTCRGRKGHLFES